MEKQFSAEASLTTTPSLPERLPVESADRTEVLVVLDGDDVVAGLVPLGVNPGRGGDSESTAGGYSLLSVVALGTDGGLGTLNLALATKVLNDRIVLVLKRLWGGGI